jgi:hypothetical protein
MNRTATRRSDRIIDNGSEPVHHGSLGRAAIVAVVVVLLVLYVLFCPAVRPPTKTALGRPRPARASKEEIFEAYYEVTHSYTKDTLNLLVRMLFELPTYIVRISEQAKIDEAPVIHIITRQYYEVEKSGKSLAEEPARDIPGNAAGAPSGTAERDATWVAESTASKPELLLIPLAQPEKGVLLDSFTVTDASGSQLPTLTQNRMRALIVYTLEGLLKTAIGAGGVATDRNPKNAWQESLLALAKMVTAVCSAGPRRKQSPNNQRVIREALEAIDTLPLTRAWRARLKQFCLYYIDHYVIVAEVPRPPGDHLVLTYSYRVPGESPTNQSANRWRSRFGLTLSTFDLPVHVHAFQVDSYHLQVEPDMGGQYVYNHHLEWLNTSDIVKQEQLEKESFRPYVRLYHDEGRPNAHLYIRRQGDTSAADKLPRLKSVIEFREIPPGVQGAATVVAAAGAALITFFALTHLGLGVDVESGRQQDQIIATLNSDIPALLLALPAFTAALIGSWTDLTRVRRASLTTYLALAATMFLSLGSAFYFVFDANHKLPTEFTARLLGGVQITTEAFWLVLMGVSWTLILFMFRQWISESRHYFRAVKRRVDSLFNSIQDQNEERGRVGD